MAANHYWVHAILQLMGRLLMVLKVSPVVAWIFCQNVGSRVFNITCTWITNILGVEILSNGEIFFSSGLIEVGGRVHSASS